MPELHIRNQLGDGWVYAVQEDGTPLVKFGYTKNHDCRNRVIALRGLYGVPITLIASVWVPGFVVAMEKALHRHYAATRIQGEWFYLHMDEATFGAAVQELLPEVQADGAVKEMERQEYLRRFLWKAKMEKRKVRHVPFRR